MIKPQSLVVQEEAILFLHRSFLPMQQAGATGSPSFSAS